ncbi:MAG: murein transglycosylase A [Rhodobacteraceae bacterium]|nr:murein transglycosylase A [Paracoccaceae bacterium]
MTSGSKGEFDRLPGWRDDDLQAALAVFRAGLEGPAPAEDPVAARDFFETTFLPGPTRPALLTGYYQPEIAGAAVRDDRFCHPLYGPPPDIPTDRPWYTRKEIEQRNLLAGQEIVWLTDPVDAFFAQVQGSVRVRLPDGTDLRLGFGGKNGHPYKSIGAELIRRGEIAGEEMSAMAIRRWCASHPSLVQDLLQINPSFVFFRKLDPAPDQGPLGTAGVPLAALRSIAVDPDHYPLGTPIWVETGQGKGRLMIAQDTGSAIAGSGRADIYCGSGDAAGIAAGGMREDGFLTPLLPRGRQ